LLAVLAVDQATVVVVVVLEVTEHQPALLGATLLPNLLLNLLYLLTTP
jgi:hypothetical protein